MTQLYFIRHGETEYNRLHISQGHKKDVDLNKKGIIQSHKTGKYLNQYRKKDNIPFDYILSSPLLRAKTTAKIIADEINFKKDIIFNDNLKELNMGKFTGKPKKDKYKIIEKITKKIQDENKDPIEFEKNKYKIDDYMFNNYRLETNKQAIIRAKKFINQLKILIEKEKPKKIIIVSHGKIMQNIFKCIFHIPSIDKKINMLKDNDSNCFICPINYNNLYFEMITLPSNKHLDIV